MSDIKIWNGTSTFMGSGNETPFGLYDNDTKFRGDADSVASWCAKRLGYPIVDIELQDVQFWACFEEAITEYGSHVQRYQIRQNLLDVTDHAKTDLTNTPVLGNVSNIVTLSTGYGTEAGSGGNVTYHSASIDVVKGQQAYDLSTISTSSIEIKRIFHEAIPAVERFMDPHVGSMYGGGAMLNSLGMGANSPAVNFMVMPVYDTLLRVQQIEFNTQVRKSHVGFELQNNHVRLFPVPKNDYKMWFQYVLLSDKEAAALGTKNNVSNFADIDYRVMTYSNINAPGLQWIKKYTLALTKELLGSIRSKYSSVPVPGAEVNLDGDTLRNEASVEKENLISQLREDLEASSRRNILEAKKDESEFLRETINNIPLNVYTG